MIPEYSTYSLFMHSIDAMPVEFTYDRSWSSGVSEVAGRPPASVHSVSLVIPG